MYFLMAILFVVGIVMYVASLEARHDAEASRRSTGGLRYLVVCSAILGGCAAVIAGVSTIVPIGGTWVGTSDSLPALCQTLAGVFFVSSLGIFVLGAIPAIVAYGIVRSRIGDVVAETESSCDTAERMESANPYQSPLS